jgi:NADH pyrophosphatase NudC (nudix superfamily)
MKQIKELVDDEFIHKGVREFNLSIEEYSRVLDSVVIANADVICHTADGKVLLGVRSYKPLQGKLWIFGGRMKPGESLNDTARRNIKRELGIDANPTRLGISDVYNIMWGGRHEPPQEYGFQTMMTIMMYECNSAEVELVTTTDDTNDDLHWYSRQEIHAMEKAGELHPFLPVVLRDAGLL